MKKLFTILFLACTICKAQTNAVPIVTSSKGQSITTHPNGINIFFGAPIPPITNYLNITTQPQSQTVASGSTVTFSVGAASNMSVTYQWKDNGVNIFGATSSSFSKTTTLDDNGDIYSVVVTAGILSVTSNIVLLTITSPPSMAFSYTTTPSLYRTSAAIYKSDGTMVKNLWGNQTAISIGSHDTIWDGKDDNGNYLPNGNYYAKVLKTGVEMQWMGGVGNNSDSISGVTKYHGTQASGIEIIGHKILLFHAYVEGNYCVDLSTIEHPRTKQSVGGLVGGANYRTCNDGDHTAYCLATSDLNTYYIYGVDTLGNFVNFPNGPRSDQGRSLLMSIPTSVSANNIPTGIAAQVNGQHNFVFINLHDTVYTYDRTGTYYTKTVISDSGLMACDKSSGIWVGRTKYTVNSNGSLSATGISVSGVLNVGQLACSTDGTTISYVDMAYTEQQVKFFSNSTGVATGTPLGQKGGYLHNSDVTFYKFCFDAPDIGGQTRALPLLSYCPDGSLWINDAWSFRDMHFSSTNTYIEQIAFFPAEYNTFMSVNDPVHIYAGYLRFSVDLTSSDPSHHWVLEKNYFPMIPGSVESFGEFTNVYTMSNGRTYAGVRNTVDLSDTATQQIDITDSVRYTGYRYKWQEEVDKDGNIIDAPIFGQNIKYTTGFNGLNPTYAAPVAYLSSPTPTQDSLPFYSNNNSVLPSGELVSFGAGTSNGYHMGIIRRDGTFRVLAAPSTGTLYQGEYGMDGYFNNGNGTNNPGGALSNVGNIIYWNHHGEFWRSSGQTSYHHLFDNNGLSIGVWGTLQDVTHPVGEGKPWNSGNGTHSQLAKYNGKYIMAFDDESRHAMVHLAYGTIDSTNLQYESHALTKINNTPPTLNYTDLMVNIPTTTNLTQGLYGYWLVPSTTSIFATSDLVTYGPSNRSVRTVFYNSGLNVQDSLQIALSTSTLTTWHISGQDAFSDGESNNINGYYGKSYMDIEDNANRVIARIEIQQAAQGNSAIHTLNVNGVPLPNWASISDDSYTLQNLLQYFNISYASNQITFTENGNSITVPLFNTAANGSRPTKINLHFISQPQTPLTDVKKIDLVNLRLFNF